MTVTRKAINEANCSLLHAESLLDILIKADVDLKDGDASAVFNILLGLISNGSNVLSYLDCGYGIEPKEEKVTTDA
jgi:hypothetical protein